MSVQPIKPPKGAVKKKKIVGRGDSAGKGSTCGRGHKGQKARSGGGVRPGFEGGQMPLYRRVARRGFSNYPFKKSYVPVSIADVEKRYNDGDSVTLASLKEKGLVKNKAVYVKILGNEDISKKLNVDGLKISKAAKASVEKAGGTVTGPAEEEAESKDQTRTVQDTKDKEGKE